MSDGYGDFTDVDPSVSRQFDPLKLTADFYANKVLDIAKTMYKFYFIIVNGPAIIFSWIPY